MLSPKRCDAGWKSQTVFVNQRRSDGRAGVLWHRDAVSAIPLSRIARELLTRGLGREHAGRTEGLAATGSCLSSGQQPSRFSSYLDGDEMSKSLTQPLSLRHHQHY